VVDTADLDKHKRGTSYVNSPTIPAEIGLRRTVTVNMAHLHNVERSDVLRSKTVSRTIVSIEKVHPKPFTHIGPRTLSRCEFSDAEHKVIGHSLVVFCGRCTKLGTVFHEMDISMILASEGHGIGAVYLDTQGVV
jgi:hypothetical protein